MNRRLLPLVRRREQDAGDDSLVLVLNAARHSLFGTAESTGAASKLDADLGYLNFSDFSSVGDNRIQRSIHRWLR